MPLDPLPPELTRYCRQMLFAPIGQAGQRRLLAARATLVGCGALGSVLANTLVRAGLGRLRLVDRDFVELDNLPRQVLFDEQDVRDNLPKAEAATRKLRQINSTATLEPVVADFNPTNAEFLCRDADLVLDGTDNLETRYLLNDVAVKLGRPWVFGACLGAEGLVLAVLPGQTPCLRCVWDEPPPPGTLPTCETAGVIAPVVNIVASLQATAALKILIGRAAEVPRALLAVDAWTAQVRRINVERGGEGGACPCCQQRRFDFLEGGRVAGSTTLCGRNAVQVLPPAAASVSFPQIAARLPASAAPRANAYLLSFTVEGYGVTLFADGRAIIQGTGDPAVAKSLYAKYVGH